MRPLIFVVNVYHCRLSLGTARLMASMKCRVPATGHPVYFILQIAAIVNYYVRRLHHKKVWSVGNFPTAVLISDEIYYRAVRTPRIVC